MQYSQQPYAGVVTQPQGAPVAVATQYQGAPATVVTQTHAVADNNKFHPRAAKQMLVMSVIQAAIGVICVIFGFVLVGAGNKLAYASSMGGIGYGVWIGLFYGVVGGYGIAAAQRNSARWITAAMIMHIICSVFWCALLVGFSSVGLIISSFKSCRYTYLNIYFTSCNEIMQIKNTFLAMDSLMLVMGLAEFVITIWCAVLCCGAICRCCKSVQHTHTVAQHVTTPAVQSQQTVMYPGAPVTTYTPHPAVQGQQTAYPVASAGYAGQPGQPAYPALPNQPVLPAQPTSYVSQSTPSVTYTGQPGQPAYPAQPNQLALPTQPTGYMPQSTPSTGYTGQPGQYPAQPNQPAQPTGCMSQSAPTASYDGQPSQPAYQPYQPPQPGYATESPPYYSATAPEEPAAGSQSYAQPPPYAYPTKH